jgi:periplasmic protein TonB
MFLRFATALASTVAHAAIAAVLLITPGGAALEMGTGGDQFVVDQGFAIEGVAQFGQDEVNIAAVEAEPLEASEAREAIEEVKATEKVEDTTVIASEDGPVQDVPEIKPEPVEQPRPEQVATLEQQEQVVIEEKRAAGAAKTGGNATDHSMYLGKLRTLLEKKKINPRSREVGTVIVRFSVGLGGELLNREVTKSSGSTALDAAALASIEKAAPFPAMPENVASGPLVVSVPFKFTVR